MKMENVLLKMDDFNNNAKTRQANGNNRALKMPTCEVLNYIFKSKHKSKSGEAGNAI